MPGSSTPIRWLTGTALLVSFAVTLTWGVRAFGRSVIFAFAVNWVLILWAILFASTVVRLRLPARYYATRRVERAGRLYDLMGVRWFRRTLRPGLWSVSPTLLRSQSSARETMIEGTKDAETGHLFILLVISAITVRACAFGWWDTAGWLLLFNLLHNGYPVLSMRQLRARLVAGAHRSPGRSFEPASDSRVSSAPAATPGR
jgi:hypothetical protein